MIPTSVNFVCLPEEHVLDEMADKQKAVLKRRYLPLSGLFFAVVNSYRNSKRCKIVVIWVRNVICRCASRRILAD